MSDDLPRVVIIGAGFGGLTAAEKIAGSPIDVTIVDRLPYHTFSPLLYQVATGLITPDRIEFPVEKAIAHRRNTRFLNAEITSIDLDTQVLHLDGHDDLHYDYVIISAGTTTSFFGNDQIARVGFPMKTMPEAQAVRRHVVDAIIAARRTSDADEKRRLLSFVVVGAGPTGVEFAGALAEMAFGALPKHVPEISADEVTVTMVEGGKAVLPSFPRKIQRYTKRKLEKMGVSVILGDRVVDADERSATLKSGEALDCHTLYWSAGTKDLPIIESLPVEKDRGRIEVDEFLRVKGFEAKGAYAIGDNAAVKWHGELLPGVSPPAMQEGRRAARNIMTSAMSRADEIEPFHYIDKGTMATVSRSTAVADVKGLKLTGLIGKAAWALVHIYYLAGLQQRFRLMWSWFNDWRHYDTYLRRAIEAREAELDKDAESPPDLGSATAS